MSKFTFVLILIVSVSSAFASPSRVETQAERRQEAADRKVVSDYENLLTMTKIMPTTEENVRYLAAKTRVDRIDSERALEGMTDADTYEGFALFMKANQHQVSQPTFKTRVLRYLRDEKFLREEGFLGLNEKSWVALRIETLQHNISLAPNEAKPDMRRRIERFKQIQVNRGWASPAVAPTQSASRGLK